MSELASQFHCSHFIISQVPNNLTPFSSKVPIRPQTARALKTLCQTHPRLTLNRRKSNAISLQLFGSFGFDLTVATHLPVASFGVTHSQTAARPNSSLRLPPRPRNRPLPLGLSSRPITSAGCWSRLRHARTHTAMHAHTLARTHACKQAHRSAHTHKHTHACAQAHRTCVCMRACAVQIDVQWTIQSIDWLVGWLVGWLSRSIRTLRYFRMM